MWDIENSRPEHLEPLWTDPLFYGRANCYPSKTNGSTSPDLIVRRGRVADVFSRRCTPAWGYCGQTRPFCTVVAGNRKRLSTVVLGEPDVISRQLNTAWGPPRRDSFTDIPDLVIIIIIIIILFVFIIQNATQNFKLKTPASSPSEQSIHTWTKMLDKRELIASIVGEVRNTCTPIGLYMGLRTTVFISVAVTMWLLENMPRVAPTDGREIVRQLHGGRAT